MNRIQGYIQPAEKRSIAGLHNSYKYYQYPEEHVPSARKGWSLKKLFRRPDYRLPPELWIVVFSFVLRSVDIHYYDVSYINFHLYCRWVSHRAEVEQRIIATERDYKSIRLVCRTWASLVNPGSELVIRTGTEPLRPGLTAIILDSDVQRFINNLKEDRSITSHLHTLIYGRWQKKVNGHIDDPFLLFQYAYCFPSLQCISLEYRGSRPDFLNLLQRAFPNLVSLAVRYKIATGVKVVLKKLEILDVEWDEDVSYECSSLKHVSLRRVKDLPGFYRFLKEHGPGLQSLVIIPGKNLPGYPDFNSEESFWQYLPRLRAFETTMNLYSFSRFRGPPPGYPLDHLSLKCAYMGFQEERTVTVRQIQEKLRSLPSLRRLYIRSCAFKNEQYDVIRKSCKQLGIVYETGSA